MAEEAPTTTNQLAQPGFLTPGFIGVISGVVCLAVFVTGLALRKTGAAQGAELSRVVLGLIAHAIIVSAAVLMVMTLLSVVAAARTPAEATMRTLALFLGMAVAVAAEQIGIPITSLLGQARAETGLFWQFIFKIVTPPLLGIFLAKSFLANLRSSIGIRVIILVATMLLFTFITVYARGVAVAGLTLNPNIIGNMSFALGLGLYLILKYDPDGAESSR